MYQLAGVRRLKVKLEEDLINSSVDVLVDVLLEYAYKMYDNDSERHFYVMQLVDRILEELES